MAIKQQLDAQIIDYLPQLSVRQKEAVLGVVKSMVEESENWWNTEVFDKEMLDRAEQLENKTVAGLTLDQLESNARLAFKKM